MGIIVGVVGVVMMVASPFFPALCCLGVVLIPVGGVIFVIGLVLEDKKPPTPYYPQQYPPAGPYGGGYQYPPPGPYQPGYPPPGQYGPPQGHYGPPPGPHGGPYQRNPPQY